MSLDRIMRMVEDGLKKKEKQIEIQRRREDLNYARKSYDNFISRLYGQADAKIGRQHELDKQTLVNRGKLDVSREDNRGLLERGKLDSTNKLDVQRLKNRGDIDLQKLTNEGNLSVENVRIKPLQRANEIKQDSLDKSVRQFDQSRFDKNFQFFSNREHGNDSLGMSGRPEKEPLSDAAILERMTMIDRMAKGGNGGIDPVTAKVNYLLSSTPSDQLNKIDWSDQDLANMRSRGLISSGSNDGSAKKQAQQKPSAAVNEVQRRSASVTKENFSGYTNITQNNGFIWGRDPGGRTRRMFKVEEPTTWYGNKNNRYPNKNYADFAKRMRAVDPENKLGLYGTITRTRNGL